MILEKDNFSKKERRSSVSFPHELHIESSECLDCHHNIKDGKNILDEDSLEEGNKKLKCSFCHTNKVSINIKKAFHRQCIGCHTNLSKNGKKYGPKLCAECHPKNRKTRN